ncbi:ATP-binding protein [Paraflavitalea sp. CAU 1676]|uniref:sensor histidine kinase n=1 Tax=Paraflavitalea sp. CAU 1676 TaxID=3032598 RepID=UPI0023D9B112|nr:ATP-binding protein [Paraflavitalea sp. CAU 1676]MDF2193246.1 histidine kinase [Paraflavitalea sp. CAU 1676]
MNFVYLFSGIIEWRKSYSVFVTYFAAMIRTTTLVCLIILAHLCRAQSHLNGQRYVDSLTKVLQEATADSVRAKASYLLSYNWAFKDPVKAKGYLEQGRQYAIRNPFQTAISNFYEGILLYVGGDIAGSENAFLRTDSLLQPFKTKTAYTFRSEAWHNYGVLQQAQGDEKAFADILISKAIPFAQQAADTSVLARNFHDLGLTFKNTAQYEKAASWVLKAIDMFRVLHARNEMAVAFITGAENYVLWEKFNLAKPMLDSSYVILQGNSESPLLVDYYAAESIYFNATKQFAKALESTDKGIVMARKLNRVYEEQRILLQRFYAWFDQKNYRKAKPILEDLVQQPVMMSQIINRLQIYKGLAETHAGLGEMTEAFRWSKEYSRLSDSVHESQLKTDIQALELKFKDAENQKMIATLEAANEKAALEANNNRLLTWFLASASLLLLIAAVLAWLYYRNSKKLSQQKDLNHQQQLKEMNQQQQIQFSQALLQGEERERRRVAGDLHDGLGGMLAGVKLNLTELRSATPKTEEGDFHKVLGQLDHSISELRRIARNMMPEALLKFGLETALRDLCESIMTESVRIDYQAFGIEKTMPQQTQVTIYRIVQELLSNAIRHAHASSILLQCSQNESVFLVTLEDNGKGFDTRAAALAKGIGLMNVKSRVDYLQGKMDIASVINEGTTINIELHVAG